MLGRIVSHLRGNTVGLVALCLAVLAAAGTAVAALQIRSEDIVNGQVKRPDIGTAAVASNEAANNSLEIRDLKSNSVVARPQGSTDVSTTINNVVVDYPLIRNHWTQRAHDTDVFFGQVTFTTGSVGCTDGSLSVQIQIDGQDLPGFSRSYYLTSLSNSTQYTEPFLTSRPFLFEPGVDTPREATARISDSCDNNGEDVTVNAIKILPVTIR